MIIDIIYFVVLIIFMIRGYNKGIIVALFSALAIILGVLAALKLSKTVASLLFSDSDSLVIARWTPLLIYVLIFFVVLWTVRFVASFMQRSFEMLAMGWLNRLAGALLFGFIASFVLSSLLWLFNQMHLLREEVRESSYIFPLIEPLAPKVCTLIGQVLPFAQSLFEDLSYFFERVNENLNQHVDTD